MGMRAARWNTISMSRVSSRQKWASRMSPVTTVIRSRQGESSSHPQKLNELYWDKTVTRAPFLTSISARWDPIKPSAPVTKTRRSEIGISKRPRHFLGHPEKPAGSSEHHEHRYH